jgi:hypothetical protein
MADEDRYRFGEAVRFSRKYQDVPETIKNNKVKEVTAAFETSINRVVALGHLPMMATSLSYMVGHSSREACAVFGISPSQMGEMPEDVSRYTNYKIDSYAKAVGDSHFRWEIRVRGSHLLNELVTMIGAFVADGIEAVLSAMIVESWGAFESLSEDLWKTAVNICPSAAVTNMTKRAQILKPSNAATISISVLQGRKFDLRSCFGDMLVEERKVNFHKFNDTKKAYKIALGDDIEAELSKHNDLYAIEQIRNLLAHRGGVADRKFIDEMIQHGNYNTTKIGDKIRLDGPLVCSIIDELVICSVVLCQAVDGWVMQHEEQKA